MKTQSLCFGEAVKTLAAEAGMQPYRFSNFDKKKDLRFQNYKKIFKDYSNYFRKELFNKNNKEALDYIFNRGLNKNNIEEFNLGYVPWKNNFYEELIKSYTEEEINLTGLYYKNDKTGKYVDRFNSRILFPVNNISGDTVAFGGRIIRDGQLAKYINSPETEFYKKGNIIYNLDKAKNERAQTNEVIIVEGYMDVVSLSRAGIRNVISNSGTALTEMQISLIWKFFSNPIICLDGDESGKKAAYRIAERLFPLLNDKNKIYFLNIEQGSDPDDYIKKHGKKNFLRFLEEKQIIQSFIWNYNLNKINQSNPFEVTNFEKEIKRLSYSIKDETLKKYVLEDFLERFKNFTPLQSSRKKFNFSKFGKDKDLKILKETKILHQKRKDFSKIQILEFSILFIILNYIEIASKKVDELKKLIFVSEKNENFKNIILKLISDQVEKSDFQLKINKDFNKLVEEIKENSNVQLITNGKSEEEILELLNELIIDLKEQNNLKKIESLEKKLINNLDENSYSELVKLKSQLNRD